MAFRFQLPHRDSCQGFDIPGRDGRRARTYYRDPHNPGSVVIGNEHDAGLAAKALGQAMVDESSTARFDRPCMSPTWDCGCGKENWGWVDACPRCGDFQDAAFARECA